MDYCNCVFRVFLCLFIVDKALCLVCLVFVVQVIVWKDSSTHSLTHAPKIDKLCVINTWSYL